jgi:phage terminase large subunit GpA-like protein
MYASARDVRRNVARMFAPPANVSVSQSIAQVVVTNSGKYDAGLTPYMRAPCDALGSRRYRIVCFLGPGRTGKTQALIDGWIGDTVVRDPGDMLIVQASQDLARSYSRVRVKRMIDASPRIKELQSKHRQDDNTYDKAFSNGMYIAFGWPSSAQLSGRDFRKVAITEYDAAADDIDGEGSLLALAGKRVETFLSAGKVLVETSVRRAYTDAKWRRSVPHEAPPARGGTAIYNGGTMCWLYWRCEHCGKWTALDPDIHEMFPIDSLPELVESLKDADAAQWARDHARVPCKSCGVEFDESRKRALNGSAIWVPSGCEIIGDCVVGTPRDTQTDSYQLSSIAAAYQSWRSILEKYAIAIQDYIRTGNETEIKGTVNLDQGRAYCPISVGKQRSTVDLMGRGEAWEQASVPHGVRFLTAHVDVQAGQRRGFIVQVVGWGANREKWIVDRYALRTSERMDATGTVLPIDPSAYVEDWRRLIAKCIERRYPLSDGSGRTMPIKLTTCDSGGEDGVTSRAYEFYRLLLRLGLQRQFLLTKGSQNKSAPMVEIRTPDTRGKADRGASSGDVPVLFINTDMLKDTLAADLDRKDPGPGFWHFPNWLHSSFYDELTAETRGEKGWQASRRHNESIDLCVQAEATWLRMECDRIDWQAPPSWASEWSLNPLVCKPEDAGAPGESVVIVRRKSTYWNN